jgi:quinol monooxygenase YgiN
MIIVAGTFRIAQGKKEAALPHMRAVIEATRAEPGCVTYSFAFDALDDHLVRVFEIYKDAEAVDAHRKAPAFLAWRAAGAEAGVSDRDISVHQVSSSQKV